MILEGVLQYFSRQIDLLLNSAFNLIQQVLKYGNIKFRSWRKKKNEKKKSLAVSERSQAHIEQYYFPSQIFMAEELLMFVSLLRNVLTLNPHRVLPLCLPAGLLDLWSLRPQRTLHPRPASGGCLGETDGDQSQLHIP